MKKILLLAWQINLWKWYITALINKKSYKKWKKDTLKKKLLRIIYKTETIKEKSRELYKNLSKEEKDKIKEYQRKKYQELVQYKKEALKN